MEIFLSILITLFFVLLNGFFVAAEFAIVKVRGSQIELKAQEGNRTAVLAKHITHHLDAYLAATQFGITIASLALGMIGEPVVSKLVTAFFSLIGINFESFSIFGFEITIHAISIGLAFLIITILHIVFGELAPKSIAIQRSEQTTLFVSYPLQAFYWLCRPMIWLLNGVANFFIKAIGLHSISEEESTYSSDELKYLVDQATESGQTEAEGPDFKLIKNAFDFSERTAKQIMVPRTHVVAIDLNDYELKDIEHVIDEGFSRIPCYEDNIDNTVGIVHLKDLLEQMWRSDAELVDIRSVVRPVSFIPETKRIGVLLKEFQIKHQQIAMVLNEYGGVEGVITMEDILEELVGEIQDESDNEIPFVEKKDDNTYVVLATAAISDINDNLPHPIDREKQYDTLAGYLIDKFGRIPTAHDSLESEGYEYIVLKKMKTSIVLVQMRDLLVNQNEEDESTK
ncbi:hemolysin family protein [Dysgonomonas massiliensis]|uniref:hemolysin family protein n=1 Tax=Dysgonomonas massiliensis TaxID=2040292 RepID=UPI000C791DAA|nr:hemolysin family protein [Dysgonomonas massiliensis]